ncbi:MAG: hypothetical protein JWM16_5907 [Verrucomicrobiales bacterium]|nr:hypothetical protein [Verrucomicrobiales bacterium]
MKTTKVIVTLLAGTLLTMAAQAQVELTITGSTAFRSIALDRAGSLFDGGSAVTITNDAAAGKLTFSGTVSNAVPSLGSTPVKVRLSFSGSASGMIAVKNSTPVNTAEAAGGVTVNKVPDLALSDVFPGSATPAIAESSFNRTVVGVVPFAFVANNALVNGGVTNLTRDQAVLLMTSSGSVNGIDGMPASFLGANPASPLYNSPVYLTGRDSGSGTRITTEKVIGFIGNPILWATNGAGNYVLTNGYSSGASERQVISAKPEAIGYLGLGDAATIAATSKILAYNGVPYSHTNVATGSYAIWGYEHMVNRAGGLSANQTLVKNAFVAAITNPNYQRTNVLYAPNFVPLSDMQVERGADGGLITSKNF